MCKQRFNYKKEGLNEYQYAGFHLKDGKNHIDTKRLIKLGYKDKFPESLFSKPRNTHYFIPKYKTRYEYAVNRLIDTVDNLTTDWNVDYKDAIGGLKTPKQAQDEEYLNIISGTTSSEDIDVASFNSIMAGVKRSYKYTEVVASIHYQYIQKMFIDFFRSIMLVLKDKGFAIEDDFDYKDLIQYAQKQLGTANDINPFLSLPHFKYFDLLRCINNFLKHNTIRAYRSLAESGDKYIDDEQKHFLSLHVLKEKEVRRKYETGMYAGSWLRLKPSYVDDTLNNLREFSKELCQLLYNEDANEASWNYDDYLVEQLKKAMIEL